MRVSIRITVLNILNSVSIFFFAGGCTIFFDEAYLNEVISHRTSGENCGVSGLSEFFDAVGDSHYHQLRYDLRISSGSERQDLLTNILTDLHNKIVDEYAIAEKNSEESKYCKGITDYVPDQVYIGKPVRNRILRFLYEIRFDHGNKAKIDNVCLGIMYLGNSANVGNDYDQGVIDDLQRSADPSDHPYKELRCRGREES